MMIDLNKLKELAQKATKGTWKMIDGGSSIGLRVSSGYQGFFNVVRPHPSLETEVRANTAFIEACDPSSILELITVAERAVSPAESVQSIDTPEFRKLVDAHHDEAFSYNAEYRDAKLFPEWKDLVAYINASRAAAHAEGRRSAMEELAKEKERADRLDSALKEWLDKTQWVQDAVQSNQFSVMYLGHHRADVIRQEFDTLKERADRAEATAAKLNSVLELANKRIDAMLSARQAPDLSKAIQARIAHHEVKLADDNDIHCGCSSTIIGELQALLAQPLQQEGGKIRGYLTPGNEWTEFHSTLEAAQAACDEYNLYWRSQPEFDPEDERIPEAVYYGPQPDNLQQASTAQGESARTNCPHCGTHEVSLERTCHNSACNMYGHGETVYEGWKAVAPAQATPEGADLPPLPQAMKRHIDRPGGLSFIAEYYTADQMRDYARNHEAHLMQSYAPLMDAASAKHRIEKAEAAIASAAAAEPVAWMYQTIPNGEWRVTLNEDWANALGTPTVPLYRAAPPQQVEEIDAKDVESAIAEFQLLNKWDLPGSAERVRAELSKAGVTLTVTPEGTISWKRVRK